MSESSSSSLIQSESLSRVLGRTNSIDSMSNEESDTGEANRLGDGGGKRGDEVGDDDGKVGDDVEVGDEVGDGKVGNDEDGNDEDGSGEDGSSEDKAGSDEDEAGNGENRVFKEGQYGRGRIRWVLCVGDTVRTRAVVVGGIGKARTRVRRGDGTFCIDEATGNVSMSVLGVRVFGRAPRGWRVTASLLDGTGCIVMGGWNEEREMQRRYTAF